MTGAWLVWRRDKDEFGRDYYNFTLRTGGPGRAWLPASCRWAA